MVIQVDHGHPLQLELQLPNINGCLELGIRPEFVSLSATDGLDVEITAVEDLGRYRVIRTQFGAYTICLVQQNATAIPDRPRLTFDSEKVMFYKDALLLGSL